MKLVVSWLALLLAALPACSRGGYDAGDDDTTDRGGSGGSVSALGPLPVDTEFTLRDEFEGPCSKATSIDVNLGNSPEAFVRAAQCQITGNEPDAATVKELTERLRTLPYVRRVDVVRTLCMRANQNCILNYTDPWQAQVDLTTPCVRKGTRDLGAVLMYWSECPSGVNCGLDWANTHVPGMGTASQLLSFGESRVGYYNPKNGGFWRRELLDARWSGLQFLLLNTFGPDLAQLPRLVEALDDIGGGIQVALFDDTWGWGRGGAPWNQMPTFNDPEGAAQLIYQKWHLFYTAVPSQYWYRYNNRPLIAFYNAGTLNPQTKSAATLARLRELFNAEFHEDPFLVIDRAFFQDPGTVDVADAQFRWNTFDFGDISHYETKGVTFDHFMAKWDSIGRENNGRLAEATDRVIKGPEKLDEYLEKSAGSNLAMMATWNDLGEGTGLTRNFDYYYQGAWLPPNAFMSHIRQSQCQ
ncbi:MAG TPA: DUF5010 domain-containing protein [Polyangiaceae bacterium]|nr:DUF5010 domain-containing protein [Polyangiaceae bacterium]